MKVQIWSDVVCPFCYIGKRKFELALESFSAKKSVIVEWKSFQLDPTAQPVPGKSQAEVLAAKKGWSLEQTHKMMDQVSQVAASVGLQYNMDKTVVANTFQAHRLIHLAKRQGLQNEAEERLFQAYFTEGLDIGQPEILKQLGLEIGLNQDILRNFFDENELGVAVQRDQLEAQQLGISGVPFFVFNEKYAVSGAQDPAVFQEVLHKVWQEEAPVVSDDGFCTPDGICK